MLERIWIGWLVLVLVLGLTSRFLPALRGVKSLLTGVFWAGAISFLLWLTDGRLALFVAIGFFSALAGLVSLVTRRTTLPAGTRLPTVARLMAKPALVLGTVTGIALECGGRWSGQSFVVWRAMVGGVVVLIAGLALVARKSRA